MPVGNVVVEAFPAAYKAVVTGRSPSVTDELFSILDWDKAKALRKELIRSFTASAWPPHQLALTANRCDILPKIIKRLQRKWGGEDYIKQMSHELANLDTPEAKSALARLKGVSDDPQYHEYWD